MTMDIMNNTNTSNTITNTNKNSSNVNTVKPTDSFLNDDFHNVLKQEESEKSFDNIIKETYDKNENNKNQNNNQNDINKSILQNKDNKVSNFEYEHINQKQTSQDNFKADLTKYQNIMDTNNINNNKNNSIFNKSNINKKDNTITKDNIHDDFELVSEVENEFINKTHYFMNNFESLPQFNKDNINLNEIKKESKVSPLYIQAFYKDTENNIKQINMSMDDVKFFANVVDMNIKNNNIDFEINETNLRSAKVSNELLEMLNDSKNTGRPIRVDFDNNISVVMQITKDGKLNARFYPGDKAAEEYLKQNIQNLKANLDSNDVDYNEISYKEHKNQSNKGNKRNNSNNGKESE